MKKLLVPSAVMLTGLLAGGCQTYRYLEYDPKTGNLVKDGFANGIVTKPAFKFAEERNADGSLKLNLDYARENDIEGLGAAIGAAVKAAK